MYSYGEWMSRKKKSEDAIYVSDRDQRLSNLRTGKISKEYLLPMVMHYKSLKAINIRAQMPRELAEVILIIIDKNLGSPSWRRYSPDWKEEMRGRAIEHLLKYSHNFDPQKCAAGNDDPYNYFAMIANMAFIQSLKKLKMHSDHTIIMNHDVLYNETQWAQFSETVGLEVEVSEPQITNLDWGQSL